MDVKVLLRWYGTSYRGMTMSQRNRYEMSKFSEGRAFRCLYKCIGGEMAFSGELFSEMRIRIDIPSRSPTLASFFSALQRIRKKRYNAYREGCTFRETNGRRDRMAGVLGAMVIPGRRAGPVMTEMGRRCEIRSQASTRGRRSDVAEGRPAIPPDLSRS